MHLRCSDGQCSTLLDIRDRALSCPRCGDLLEVGLGPGPFDADSLKQIWLERRISSDPRDRSGIWRFREFLPDLYDPGAVVTLEEGNVPLLAAPASSRYAGLDHLWFKHLGWNPTGSFKDGGMTVAVTQARHLGATQVASASTGNTAASMAAYAARAGIAARVYLPQGAISMAKLAQSIDYGAEIVQVEGNFDSALERLLRSAGPEVYFLNSINPFRIEGQKIVVFSLMEQLDWKPPDYIVLPGGNLGNASAFGKALQELKATGLIEKVPRMVVVQAEGANPFVRMWQSGIPRLEVIREPRTAASAICIGAPRSWKKALRALQFTGGLCLDVSEEEIAEAKAVIGGEGIGCEPASATTLAGIRRLIRQKKMDPAATVVAVLTGHALKDTDYIIRAQKRPVSSIESQISGSGV
ncbi:MAG: threonine synthase [Acidobacteria bacterium]|nr:threonine synthase [Acidobacteriota bacterium]